MKSKKGNMGIAIIAAIFVFIVGISMVNIFMPEVTSFREDMDCGNAEEISDATKLVCLVGGISIPMWIITITSIALGGIIIRIAIK